MNQNRRRLYKKYYFSNTSTLSLPFFFVTLSLFIFLQQFNFFSIKNIFTKLGFIEGLSDLVNGIYNFLLITVIASFFTFLRNHITKNVQACSLAGVNPFIIDEYDKDKVIHRDKQLAKLKFFFERTFNNNMYAFFVGKSGSGKSLLLNEYEKKYEKFDKKITRFSAPDYTILYDLEGELDSIIKECKSSNICHFIFFDQFERTLTTKNRKILECIVKFLKDSKNTAISIAFVCTNEDYVQVLEKLQSKLKDSIDEENNQNGTYFNYDTYFLRILPEEKKDMLEQLEDELQLEENDKRYELFNNLLADPEDVSMIQINIARNYFGEASADEYERMLDIDEPIDRIVEKYFEKVFAGIDDPNLVMIMLYSLCKYSNGLTESDFKNLTFAPKETVDIMLRILKKQKIMKQVKPVPESPYIMTHDYLTKHLEHYCKNKLSEQIIINIDFYCKEKEKRKERSNKSGKTTGSPLSFYYRNTVNKKTSSIIISFCMCALCSAVLFVCVMHEINGYGEKYIHNMKYEWNHTILALTVLAIGSAIYYIYHYLCYFAKIFFSKMCIEFWICILLILWGMTSVILALIINGLWVSWLAIEWMMIGILHFALSRKNLSNENAKARLRGEGLLYIIIAIGLIVLNIIVLWLGGIMYPWFIIFVLFVCLTIRQHINSDFMHAKLGSFVNLRLDEDL